MLYFSGNQIISRFCLSRAARVLELTLCASSNKWALLIHTSIENAIFLLAHLIDIGLYFLGFPLNMTSMFVMQSLWCHYICLSGSKEVICYASLCLCFTLTFPCRWRLISPHSPALWMISWCVYLMVLKARLRWTMAKSHALYQIQWTFHLHLMRKVSLILFKTAWTLRISSSCALVHRALIYSGLALMSELILSALPKAAWQNTLFASLIEAYLCFEIVFLVKAQCCLNAIFLIGHHSSQEHAKVLKCCLTAWKECIISVTTITILCSVSKYLIWHYLTSC